MKTKEAGLSPTIWRTCRVLANPNRLRCLKAVLKCPGRSVEDVAAVVGLTEVKASLALRALQSRGLLSSKRRSRWLQCHPETDPAVVSADLFLDAAKRFLVDSRMSEQDFRNAMQAYSHPRRIAIFRAVAHADNLHPADLCEMLDVSPEAVARHLRKLKALDVVQVTKKGCVWSSFRSDLAEVLLRIILS